MYFNEVLSFGWGSGITNAKLIFSDVIFVDVMEHLFLASWIFWTSWETGLDIMENVVGHHGATWVSQAFLDVLEKFGRHGNCFGEIVLGCHGFRKD